MGAYAPISQLKVLQNVNISTIDIDCQGVVKKQFCNIFGAKFPDIFRDISAVFLKE